jgi:flagellar biosynthesis/type III secretory pathway protein FliH
MSEAGNAGYQSRILRAEARRPASPEAVVPAPVVDPVKAEADQLVARAEAQARSLLNQAMQEGERIRHEAAQQADAERQMRLADELLKFSRRLRKELDDIRPRLARMVVEAVESIIGTLPEDEVAERMIRRGLRDLDAETRVTLHCARADRPTLAAIVERMAEAGEHSISSVDADTDLDPGTCRLESAGVSVELGIRAQLDLLEELLLREEQAVPGRDLRSDLSRDADFLGADPRLPRDPFA